MTDLEFVMCCVLIPVAFIVTYVAGKRDVLGLFCEMLQEKVAEWQERKHDEHSFLRDSKELLDKADEQGYLSGFDFSILMHRFLISEGGYVIDTGNYENVNAEVALRLAQKIKDNPLLWQIFMVA